MLSRTKRDELRRAPLGDAANKVRKARELADLTQVQLGERIGMNQSHLARIELGRYSDMPLETVRRLAEYFGVHIEDLFPARDEVAS